MNKKDLIIILTAFMFLFINGVSAFPFQLNLTNGMLIDLNASDNVTANITIYVVNQTFISQFNITNINISSTNITNCTNCSYAYNYSYSYTYIVNGTNVSFLNTTEAEAKYLSLNSFNAYKTGLVIPVSLADFNALKSQFDALNKTTTDNQSSSGSNTGLWITAIAGALFGLVGMFMSLRSSS